MNLIAKEYVACRHDLGGADAAYRKSPVLLIESPHPGGVAG
jgi:hypothetical protein